MLLTAAVFVVVVAGMRAAEAIVVPFLFSVFIAIINAPSLFWLERKGLPRWLAMLVVIGVVVAAGIGVTVLGMDYPILWGLLAFLLSYVANIGSIIAWPCPHAARGRHSTSSTTFPYDGFQSPAAGPASGRLSPESHDAIVTINAWS